MSLNMLTEVCMRALFLPRDPLALHGDSAHPTDSGKEQQITKQLLLLLLWPDTAPAPAAVAAVMHFLIRGPRAPL